MRNTPLDEPGSDSREGDDPPDRAASSDGLGGFLGRVRTAVSRVGAAVGWLFGLSNATGENEDEASETVERRRTTERTDRSTQTTDRGRDVTKPAVADRPAEKPVPASSDEGPRDRPELVARWHDDRLTLSEPDETGAQLSSDTWAEVDP